MDALELKPGTYQGTYKLVGGRPSLDLVNTISWPGTDRAHDWLDSVDNLQRWLKAVGLPRVAARHSSLEAAHEARATLAAVLRPLAHGERPTHRAFERFNQRLAQASARRVIDPATLSWTWKSPEQAADVFCALFLDAAELLTTVNRDRLRHCPACDWLFVDQTRNGQRRWCDMADCGSRDKSRRYDQRTQR